MSSDYAKYGRAYYLAHKTEILAAEKEKKRWKDYYVTNKEKIAERNRVRYYAKKGIPVPDKDAPKEVKAGRPRAPDNALVERFETLVAELRSLAPHVVKPKKAKRAKKTPEQEVPAEPKAEAAAEATVEA
jgi:hypothetical protein